ncbi:hypothetical protein D3C80_1852970 [compost metagenome]
MPPVFELFIPGFVFEPLIPVFVLELELELELGNKDWILSMTFGTALISFSTT